MSSEIPIAMDDPEEAKERAEFEAAMGPHVEHLSPEMYNLRLVLFSATKDEAAAKRKKVTESLDE